MSQRAAALAAIEVPGDSTPWQSLGFGVDDGVIALANGAIRVGAETTSLIVERLDGPAEIEAVAVAVDGIRVRSGASLAGVEQPNGALELDHVVLMTDSIDRTSADVERVLGLSQRRIRETERVRQAFHRFADTDEARGCIVEVVERADLSGTSLWGLVVNVADLDAAVAAGAGLLGAPRDAVQPGRRIATVGRAAGLPLAVAFMSR